MGLLDLLSSGSQGGYGGLLDSLMYPSPLTQKDNYATNEFDSQFLPQRPDPFGPPPQMAQWAQQFAPPSPFNGTAPAAPVQQFAGVPVGPQSAPPPAAPSPPQDQPANVMNVGGYQMPQMGQMAEYTPQATDFSAQSRQSQPAAQQPQEQPQALPPAFGGSGPSFGRMFNPDGLIAKLTGNDSRSIAQQNLKAQYDSLVPMLGPQKAMLAVMNPEAGKILLAQALEKKQYGFTKLDNDTVLRQDPQTGKVEVAYGGGNRSDTIPGPDGKPIQIPPNLDPSARKAFVDEVARTSAKAAGGELTEAQAKSTLYASKMELSNKSISDAVGTSLAGKIASGIPLGNYAQSAEYQKYKQASSNFITALLRQESGAAISKSEFDRYEKEYMPQPGDGPEVLAQKTDARRVAIEGMKKGAGPGYKSPSGQTGAVRRYNPTTGTIE